MYSNLLKYAAGCAAFLLLSCSVKEDRSVCPCHLTVDPSCIFLPLEEDLASLDVSGAGSFLLTQELYEVNGPEPFVVEVPRPNVFLTVHSGAGDCFLPGEGIRIPPGEQCPPVYMYSRRIVTDGETAEAAPLLSKQYCLLTVRIVPLNDVFLESFHLSVEGTVCGYNLDASPAPGEFRCASAPSAEGICEMCLPRQRDNSLMMQVLEGEHSLRWFALGEYIAASGYDWTTPDLEDIYLEIDYAATEFTIRVNDWETTIEREVLI